MPPAPPLPKDTYIILILFLKLILFFLNEFDRYFIIGLGHILFKEDLAVQDLQPALDILQPQAYIALIQLVEIILCDPAPVVMETDKEFVAAGILGQMNKTGITVLQDIVHQLLDHPENDQFILRLQPLPVIMETGTGVHAAGAADLLEKVIYCRFQSKILQGRGHQAMGDIADQLDSIVDDLLGIIDALQLGGLIEIDEILIQVQPGRSQEGTGVIMQIRGDPLPFLFLQPDRGIEEEFLLILLHLLELQLIPDNLPLVKDDKDDQPDGKCQHADSAKKQHQGYVTRASDF